MTTREPSFSLLLPPLPVRPRTIAFASGKGGVGKSNLVLNTGLLLARRGRRVAILDGDLGLAGLNVLLGQTPRHDLRDVLLGTKRLDEILLRGPHGLLVVPAGCGVAELANLGDVERNTLFDQVRELEESVDFLLIDTGAGLGDTVLTLIRASDESIVVTRPEPTALADAYALMKVIIQQQAAYPFHVLINLVSDSRQAHQVFRSLSQILVRFLGYQPGYAGFVVADPAVGQAVVQQVPFAELTPRAPATRCLNTLASRLLGDASSVGEPTPTFWEKVSGTRRRPC
jgi:flagellar biosynthesis protein FlhG